MNLKTAVGSRKSRQALGAPGKTEKLLITNKVITSFSISLCTPISYLSFSRSTAVSRMKDLGPGGAKAIVADSLIMKLQAS
ncbi:MAG: hypothetical protein GY792_25625 [Gammaproteobacteria bacterium]|nr:hypothetical protein [Gammaproteobacteria bacterium]